MPTTPRDPLADLEAVEAATNRLLSSVQTLDTAALAAPSLLPGWTRGHVCSHVDGNADSLVNLLTSARTGVDIPQYASAEARDEGIDSGATRTREEHLTAIRESAARLADAVHLVPPEGWHRVVTWRGGTRRPATEVLWARLREVEIHHVDLGLDYTPARWTDEFTAHVLANATAAFRALDPPPAFDLHSVDTDERWQLGPAAAPVTVSGAQAALLAWLIGRSSGDGLSVDGPDGHRTPLPVPPPWL